MPFIVILCLSIVIDVLVTPIRTSSLLMYARYLLVLCNAGPLQALVNQLLNVVILSTLGSINILQASRQLLFAAG
jgi:hypothetical protein